MGKLLPLGELNVDYFDDLRRVRAYARTCAPPTSALLAQLNP